MMEKQCPLCGHELEVSAKVFIDEDTNSIMLDGMVVKAPRKVRQLLSILIDKSPRALSREFLMDELYGLLSDKEEPNDKIIAIFISHARKALKGSNYEILTVWGKGWLFRKKIPLSQELKVEEHNGREESQQLTG